MKKQLTPYYLSFILLIFIFSAVSAQNIGEYIYPFNNQILNTELKFKDVNTLNSAIYKAFAAYNNIDFKLIHQNESLGSINYTYQVYFLNIPLEQAWVKIHFQKQNKQILLFQTNLPEQEIWNNLDSNFIENTTIKSVLLIENETLLIVDKIRIENEKTDHYAEQFILENGTFYENSLKYYYDTTAYAKVFLPDPLTSANKVYGGNYQDAFNKDTSALLIQSLNNTGNNTITANSTNYTYDGQNFNVNTESYVNPFTDSIIYQVLENIFLDGQKNVLGYNTTITNNLSTFTSQIIFQDYNYPELEAEQVWQEFIVNYDNGKFKLENDFFIISEFSAPTTIPAISLTDSFNFNRSQLEFEDVNAFFHLNNYKKHWEYLGFTNLADTVILVDAHGNNGADNSFFSPSNPPKLTFGQGGVDDAEDADVIIHEYAHAISYFASPNSNNGSQRKALDEGFGDYLATSYSLQFSNFNWFKMFTWDGHNEFWSGRITNSPRTALDISSNHNIYFNAEIWSSTLMDLYFKIGADNTDKLAIEIMHYNIPNLSLSQAALNLFKADTAIFGGLYSCDIFKVLEARKFISGTCQNYIVGIKEYNQNNGGAQLYNTEAFKNSEGDITIEIKEDNFKTATYKIIDLNGAILSINEFKEPRFELKNLNLQAGVYFIEVISNNNIYSFKILKNK